MRKGGLPQILHRPLQPNRRATAGRSWRPLFSKRSVRFILPVGGSA